MNTNYFLNIGFLNFICQLFHVEQFYSTSLIFLATNYTNEHELLFLPWLYFYMTIVPRETIL